MIQCAAVQSNSCECSSVAARLLQQQLPALFRQWLSAFTHQRSRDHALHHINNVRAAHLILLLPSLQTKKNVKRTGTRTRQTHLEQIFVGDYPRCFWPQRCSRRRAQHRSCNTTASKSVTEQRFQFARRKLLKRRTTPTAHLTPSSNLHHGQPTAAHASRTQSQHSTGILTV